MRPVLLFLATVLLVLAPAAPRAQIDNEMTRMFQMQGNATSPGVLMGQRRGIVTLGEVSLRSRIIDPTFAQIRAPSISAGCGGIDIIGGSLSMISADMFVDYLRAIASNAAGYAFQLALSSMCSKCENIMAKLQEITQMLNQGAKSSCEWAQYLVEGENSERGNAIRGWGEQLGTAMRLNAGASPDQSHASNPQPGQNSALADAPEEEKAKVVANFVYRALRENNRGRWLGGSGTDRQLLQDMMSVTGTAIGCIAGEDGCPSVGDTRRPGEYELIPYRSLLSLADLVDGARPGPGGGNVTVLRCVGSDDRCLAVEIVQLDEFKSITELIRTALLGELDERDTGGAIGRLERDEELDPEMITVLSATRAGHYIMNLATVEPMLARSFVQLFASQIAAEFLRTELDKLLSATAVAVSQTGGDPAGETYRVLREAEERIARDYEVVMARSQAALGMQVVYESFMAQAPRPATIGSPSSVGM
jgi:conjugative transfer pilus assembly protein TraH